MECSASTELVHDFIIFKVFADGRVEKRPSTEKIPPSDDPITGVRSKDVTISPDVSVRIFLPQITSKRPVLVYAHGGGFAIESAFSECYHSHVEALAAEARAICVSVEYGLAPEYPVTACYEHCWEALQWVVAHASGEGPEPWLNQYADFSRFFIAGDSAGGNIAYNLTVRAGKSKLPDGVKLVGSVLVHPYFSGPGDQIDQMWLYICPDHKGLGDPRIRPDREDLKVMGGERMLVFVAEKDEFDLRERGLAFVEEVRRSGWSGKVDGVEAVDEGHCFHLNKDKTRTPIRDFMNRFVSFINEEDS